MRIIRDWNLLEPQRILRDLDLDLSDLPAPKVCRAPSLVPLQVIDVDLRSFEFGETAADPGVHTTVGT